MEILLNTILTISMAIVMLWVIEKIFFSDNKMHENAKLIGGLMIMTDIGLSTIYFLIKIWS